MEDFTSNMKSLIESLEEGEEDPSENLDYLEGIIQETLELGSNYASTKKRKASSGSQDEDLEDLQNEEKKQITTAFLKTYLPKAVQTLVDQKFKQKQKLRVNVFFQSVLKIIVTFVSILEIEELLKIQRKLFDEDSKFYAGAAPSTPQLDAEFTDSSGSKAPSLLLDNINFFGKIGGFETILSRIEQRSPKVSCQLIFLLLRPIAEIRLLLKQEFYEQFITKLYSTVFPIVLKYSEQELKSISKKSFTSFIDIMDALLSSCFESQKVGEIIEPFRLQLALKLFFSESLEKRLNGLVEINALIEMARLKDSEIIPNIDTENNNENEPVPSKWIDSSFLITNLLENHVLEEIFGARIHHELVKRSSDIFLLFSRKNQLHEKHIELLWNSSLGNQQETLVDSLYKVMKKLAPILSVDLLDYLFEKIQLYPLMNFDKKLLKLIGKLNLSCINNSEYINKGKWTGLTILWNFIQLEGHLPIELINDAFQILMEVLCDKNCQSKRETFINYCITNLKEGKSVYRSIKTLKKILAMYPKQRQKNENIPLLIKNLQENHDLLALILNELVKYKTTQKQFNEPQLKTRMKFLDFILTNSEIWLNEEQTALLWDHLIFKVEDVRERDFGFKWFDNACGNEYLFHDTLQICQVILEQKLNSLSGEMWTEVGFQCFENYFKYVNGNQTKLVNWEAFEYVVVDFKLCGLNIFWSIALYAIDDSVSFLATDHLNSLFEKFSHNLRENIQFYFNQHLNQIMYYLNQYSSNSSSSSEILITRALNLLKNFIQLFQGKNLIDEKNPSLILVSTPQYFNQLFSLLDTVQSPSICDQVWNLINSLPINPSLYEKIYSCHQSQSSWDDIFFIQYSSSLRFLYSIKIVENILFKQDKDKSWTTNFVSRGGVNYLLQVILTNSKINSNFMCVSSILHILQSFLSDSSFSQIISMVDPKTLIPTLLQFVLQISQNQSNDNQDLISIVKDSCWLIIFCAQKNPENILPIYSSPIIKELCKNVLLHCPDEIIRYSFSEGMKELISIIPINYDKHPKEFFFNICLELLSLLPSDSPNCDQFFSFLIEVLPIHKKSQESFWVNLFENNFKLIKQHPTLEKYDNPKEDRVLIGLLNLLRNILHFNSFLKAGAIKSKFLHYIFFDLLFEVSSIEKHGKIAPPKCKTKASRYAAFSILLELTEGNGNNFDYLFHLTNSLHSVDETRWEYCPSERKRSATGYAGLKNMGCTCYMNSLIQQLYMLPKFRKGMLSLPERNGPDDLLGELQTMFSFLQETQRKFYDTKTFCQTNKDYDGTPIDVYVQMDVDEYFNTLCEKIENSLKGTLQEKLLQNIWCGKLSSQLICKGCPHRYERDDPFFTISLDIQNKNNILEALELYVKGEILERDNAYTCEKCSKKRDTLKRACIKILPNTLILHLKRFEFDFDSMKKIKVNSYCEFPTELNMEPYTTVGLARRETQTDFSKEKAADLMETEEEDKDEKKRKQELEEMAKRDPSYYQYQLVGVVIHRGSSESGHYYSFIKERITVDNQPAQWIEFNDKEILPFNIQRLKDECFGGKEEVFRYDPNTKTQQLEVIERTRNAYLLIYERIRFLPPETSQTVEISMNSFQISPKKQFGISQWCILFVAKLKLARNQMKYETVFMVKSPLKLRKLLWNDNKIFLNETFVFDPLYSEFLLNFIKLKTSQSITTTQTSPDQLIQFATIFYVKILLHSKYKPNLQQFTLQLISMFQNHLNSCKWFINQLITGNTTLLRELMIENYSEESRISFTDLLFSVLKMLLIYEEELFFISEYRRSKTNQVCLSSKLIRTLYQLVSYEDWTYYYYDQYFRFFKLFSLLGNKYFQYFLDSKVSTHFINFFLEDENQNAKKLTKYQRAKRRNKLRTHNFATLISFLQSVVCKCYTETKVLPPTIEIETPFQLHEEDKKHILSKAFLIKCIKNGVNNESIVKILCHLGWENSQISKYIIVTIMKSIYETEHDQLSHLFEVFLQFLQLEDSLLKERVEFGLTKFLSIMEEKKKLPKKSKACQDFLQRISEEHSYANTWLEQHASDD